MVYFLSLVFVSGLLYIRVKYQTNSILYDLLWNLLLEEVYPSFPLFTFILSLTRRHNQCLPNFYKDIETVFYKIFFKIPFKRKIIDCIEKILRKYKSLLSMVNKLRLNYREMCLRLSSDPHTFIRQV